MSDIAADIKTEAFNWAEALTKTFESLLKQVLAYLPELLGAALLLFLGWVLAHILRIITKKLVSSLDSLFAWIAKSNKNEKNNVKSSYAIVASRIIFWITIIFFVAAASNMLGWEMLSGWMETIVAYIPSVITAFFIIIVGLLIANAAKSATLSSNQIDLSQRYILSQILYIAILFTATIISVQQLGIRVAFLTNLLMVIIGVMLAGITLAFSFGAKTLVANLIGSHYFKKTCKVGDRVKIDNVEGEILEITRSAIIIETKNGKAMLPAKMFQEQIAEII